MDHSPGKGNLASVASAEAIEVRTLHFADDGTVPNNPDLPAVVLCGALGEGAAPDAVRGRLEANGWGGTWVWQVFAYHHYHPDAHEALAVASGRAELMLGGPEGQCVSVRAGDVLVLPAGTGHCQIEASANFQVCGAYPAGQERYETLRAEHPHDSAVLERIRAVPLPRADDFFILGKRRSFDLQHDDDPLLGAYGPDGGPGGQKPVLRLTPPSATMVWPVT
ncbi:cupin domain-containing protein [Roseovarius sp. D22-M7]|uniref:cupin domain-containing protein n=1 Tax=Roseovarius sp. D22-M7 TaxID=3127116 RepID=UPI00300FDBF0